MIDHVIDQLPAYAVGALDSEDRGAVDAHLITCDVCRLELDSLNETASALSLSLDIAEPPADLKTRILTEARELKVAGMEHVRPVRASAPDPLPIVPQQPSLIQRNRVLSLSFVAGFAVVLFVAGLTIGNLMSPTTSPQLRYDHLVAAAVASGEHVVALRPVSGGSATTQMSLAWSSTSASLILGPSNAPPRSDVYQLWFIRGKQKPVSIGVFSPDRSRARSLSLPASPTGYELAAMTVEPGPSGTPQPTTSPFLLSRIANS